MSEKSSQFGYNIPKSVDIKNAPKLSNKPQPAYPQTNIVPSQQ